MRQKTRHRHHHHRKPRINPIEDANRRVNAKDFNITKGIPHLTRQHILAWVIDNSDDSQMLIQFNCKAHCFGFRNIRLNCYMLKPTEKNPNRCMILELRDLDTRSSISVSTAFFPDEFLDGQDLLEYIPSSDLYSIPLINYTQVYHTLAYNFYSQSSDINPQSPYIYSVLNQQVAILQHLIYIVGDAERQDDGTYY